MSKHVALISYQYSSTSEAFKYNATEASLSIHMIYIYLLSFQNRVHDANTVYARLLCRRINGTNESELKADKAPLHLKHSDMNECNH